MHNMIDIWYGAGIIYGFTEMISTRNIILISVLVYVLCDCTFAPVQYMSYAIQRRNSLHS